MARPRNCRRVGAIPGSNYFKPRGIPLSALEEIVLNVDEVEALRLADLDGLYQQEAAEKMNVSRPTFGRIIESAHKKVAEALVKGKALKIEGGEFELAKMRRFTCAECRHSWELAYGTGRPAGCPSCKSGSIHREECRCSETGRPTRGSSRESSKEDNLLQEGENDEGMFSGSER